MIYVNPYNYSKTYSVPPITKVIILKDLFPISPDIRIELSSVQFHSEEGVFARLFPDDESKKQLAKEQEHWNQKLIERIKTGKVNPIRGWRILKGMDQKTLVERTGIGQSNLARMEKLGVEPSRKNLKKIAEALDIDIKELL